MDSFADDDAPIDLVTFVLPDNDGNFILWHTRGIGMQNRILHQNMGDLSKSLVGSSVSVVSFSGELVLCFVGCSCSLNTLL